MLNNTTFMVSDTDCQVVEKDIEHLIDIFLQLYNKDLKFLSLFMTIGFFYRNYHQ